MAEVVNVVVALVVIVFVVRWATQTGTSWNTSWLDAASEILYRRAGEDTPEQAAARSLKFKPKRVTPEMVRRHCIAIRNDGLTGCLDRHSHIYVPRHTAVSYFYALP